MRGEWPPTKRAGPLRRPPRQPAALLALRNFGLLAALYVPRGAMGARAPGAPLFGASV